MRCEICSVLVLGEGFEGGLILILVLEEVYSGVEELQSWREITHTRDISNMVELIYILYTKDTKCISTWE